RTTLDKVTQSSFFFGLSVPGSSAELNLDRMEHRLIGRRGDRDLVESANANSQNSGGKTVHEAQELNRSALTAVLVSEVPIGLIAGENGNLKPAYVARQQR
ncbi:MAG TPA: hypothetical protein VEJ63_08220, partial [Planctomycetota bacterium]|nr:hypothetical protein [Planctomycetota bacterium]